MAEAQPGIAGNGKAGQGFQQADGPVPLFVFHGLLIQLPVRRQGNGQLDVYKRQAEHGWASLMLSVWFVGGIVLMSIGAVGLYIGKIYKEVKRRPLYNCLLYTSSDTISTLQTPCSGVIS